MNYKRSNNITFKEEIEKAWLNAHSIFFNKFVSDYDLKNRILSLAQIGKTSITLDEYALKKFFEKDKDFSDKLFNELTIARLKYYLGKEFEVEYKEKSTLFKTNKSIKISWG